MANDKRKRVFVAMPFRHEHDGIFSVVREAAALLGADVIRLDEQSFAGSIISQIRSEIESADVMTAIVSEENGNVYYEIGLAHCQKKPTVLLTSDPQSLKFDLRDHRAIVYDPHHPERVRDEVVRTLRSVIEIPSDPHAFMESVFGGAGKLAHSAEHGLHVVVQTLAQNHDLQPPFALKQMQMLPDSGGMAIVVQDFMGVQVRAIVDVNGLVRNATRTAAFG